MLVLSRKVGEEIVIGNDIRITITAAGEGRIKVGVTAPKHVRVHRAELARRIADVNPVPMAAGTSGDGQ